MTEIDDAIEAAKDVLGGRGNGTYSEALDAISWLLVGISAFRQEVSDAVAKHIAMTDEDCSDLWRGVTRENLSRFIIPKPDPLVEALREVPDEVIRKVAESKDVGTCRSRIAAIVRGLQVTEIER